MRSNFLEILVSLLYIRHNLALNEYLKDNRNEHQVLSRNRRFLIPNVNSSWTFTVVFNLAVPVEGFDTTVSTSAPFSYKFNPSSPVVS